MLKLLLCLALAVPLAATRAGGEEVKEGFKEAGRAVGHAG